MKSSKRLLTTVLTLALGLGVWGMAVSFTSSGFQAGDTLSAADLNDLLNDNFEAAETAIGDLESSVTGLENDKLDKNSTDNLIIKVNNADPALSLKNNGSGHVLQALGKNGFGVAVTNEGNILLGPLANPGSQTIRIEAQAGTITNNVGSGLPVAFGVVGSDGVKRSGTSNWSVERMSYAEGYGYNITIDGETYSSSTHAVSVTPTTAQKLPHSATLTEGRLGVRFTTPSGAINAYSASGFSFIVYKVGN
jgi:hypothetical protein